MALDCTALWQMLTGVLSQQGNLTIHITNGKKKHFAEVPSRVSSLFHGRIPSGRVGLLKTIHSMKP